MAVMSHLKDAIRVVTLRIINTIAPLGRRRRRRRRDRGGVAAAAAAGGGCGWRSEEKIDKWPTIRKLSEQRCTHLYYTMSKSNLRMQHSVERSQVAM